MKREEFAQLVQEDLFRYTGQLGARAFFWAWYYESGFRITFMMRLCRHLRSNRLTRFGLYHIASFLHHRSSVRHGVFIDPMTEVGGGLFIAHALNIVVNRRCRIGRNVNLSQGITLGITNRGAKAGTPDIGDKVYIGPNAVIFGAIRIGNEAAIGANSVVTKDIPDRSVVVGVPGKVISQKGSDGYVNNILHQST
jgi:serine O-acetyltransferase